MERFHIAVAQERPRTLSEYADVVVRTLREIEKEDGHKKVGYVAAPLYAGTTEGIRLNLKRLRELTKEVSHAESFPTFSLLDILLEEFFTADGGGNLNSEEFVSFQRQILSSGAITHVFIAPDFQEVGGEDILQEASRVGTLVYTVRTVDSPPAPNLSSLLYQI